MPAQRSWRREAAAAYSRVARGSHHCLAACELPNWNTQTTPTAVQTPSISSLHIREYTGPGVEPILLP
jgi:hypothetical protein